jgi:thiazolinyl imide reductase
VERAVHVHGINIVKKVFCLMKKKYQVIVCGTRYGHIYVSAFVKENFRFHLAGILAKGSSRSKQYAREFEVPFYHDVDELPPGIDIACVVVRSKVMGGDGTEIALKLLRRGINVIQEHPVHPGDVRRCLEQASRSGVCYHVNSQYVNVEPARLFIDYIQKATTKERPVFIEATTSLIYSTLDILGMALGGLDPFYFGQPLGCDHRMTELNKTGLFPFKCLQGILAGVPLTVKLQHYHDPEDTDNNFLIMCRICIGMKSGNLTLMDVYGPVIWSGAYSVPEYKKLVNRPSFSERKMVFAGYRNPTSVSFSKDVTPGLNVIVASHWPDAIMLALDRLRMEIETGEVTKGQSEKYLIDISNAWIEIMRRFGNPQKISISKAPQPYPCPLKFRNEVLSV